MSALSTGTTFSPIPTLLSGGWLINASWAEQHFHALERLMAGENVAGLFGHVSREQADAATVQPIAEAATVAAFRVWEGSSLENLPSGSVAVVDLTGPILKYGGYWSYGTVHKAHLLERLGQAKNVSSIVLNIDSPGGQASGTAALAATIRSLGKPVVAVVNDGMAASAAMWIASACSEIYATSAGSSFGSIGAYCTLADWSAMYEKWGVKVHEIYAPQSQDKNADVRNLFAKDDDSGIVENLRQLVEDFKQDVQTGRGARLKAGKEDPFTGKMYRADQATKIGLIDGIKSFSDVLSRAHQLSQKTSSNTNMTTRKYNSLAAAAGWDKGYEATAEGMHLNHDELAAVDAALEKGAQDAQTVTAQAETITAHESRIAQLEGDLRTARESAQSWEQKAKEYGAQEANKGTNTQGGTDTPPGNETSQQPMSSVTAEAMAIYNRNAKKKA